MCIANHHLDRKGRSLYRAASLSLAIGLILWAFVRPCLAAPHAWLDAVCGLLMGFYIVASLFAAQRSRHCAPAQPQP